MCYPSMHVVVAGAFLAHYRTMYIYAEMIYAETHVVAVVANGSWLGFMDMFLCLLLLISVAILVQAHLSGIWPTISWNACKLLLSLLFLSRRLLLPMAMTWCIGTAAMPEPW